MTPAERLVERLTARGVLLEADPPDLVVRPAEAVTPDEVAALRRHKQEILAALRRRDPIAEYRHVLGRLWLLNIPANREVDGTEARALLGEQARLCDELGPVFAAAVSRQASRDWSAREKRCAFCGMENVYHDDPDSGEEIMP